VKYEIVHVNEKMVEGLSKKTTNQNMQAVGDIGATWQQFLSGVYAQIERRVDGKTIGLYTDYEGDFTMPYNFMACCEVTSFNTVNAPLAARKIPAGKYAMFTTRGHYQQAVVELWQIIWSLNLERAYDCDFEVYHNNSEDMNDQVIDIYISLRL